VLQFNDVGWDFKFLEISLATRGISPSAVVASVDERHVVKHTSNLVDYGETGALQHDVVH
jgi:hypothetical protein